MFFKTFWFLLILCIYADIIKSTTLNSFSAIQEHHQNEVVREIESVVKTGRPKVKIARSATATIVNDDFDIPADINSYGNRSAVTIFNEYEGSAVDEFNEESSKSSTDEVKFQSEHLRHTNSTSLSTQSTTNEMESLTTDENKISFTDMENSGDGTSFPAEYSTTEITSSIQPGDAVPEIIPDICLNSTCNIENLTISASGDRNSIAEGTNFTFSCKSSYSNQMLHWYKTNGSIHFLQAFGVEKELHLNVANIKPIHSGTYMCVRWVDKHTCCNLQSNLLVYELPLYQYHLIIIGLIAILCFSICIFLSVRQLISLKTYTKQFVEKHGSVRKQLL